MNFNKKAQIAIEYMLIIGLVMLISIPTLLVYQNHSTALRKEIKLNQARIAIQTISDVAQNTYYSGTNTKETLKIYFPEGIENIIITKHEIYLVLGGTRVYVFSEVPLNGTLRSFSGVHNIILESKYNGTSFVFIRED